MFKVGIMTAKFVVYENGTMKNWDKNVKIEMWDF